MIPLLLAVFWKDHPRDYDTGLGKEGRRHRIMCEREPTNATRQRYYLLLPDYEHLTLQDIWGECGNRATRMSTRK